MNDKLPNSLEATEVRIAWVLGNPAMSSWLKDALLGALEQNPLVVSNDVEVLSNLLRARADAWTQDQLSAIGGTNGQVG